MTPTDRSDDVLEAARVLVAEGADAESLYSQWFHRVLDDIVLWPSGGTYRTVIHSFARYEAGWCVSDVGAVGPSPRPATLVVERNGVCRAIAPPAWVPTDPFDLAPRPGATVLVDPLHSDVVQGFWHVWSAGWQERPPERIRRIYLAVTAETAPLAMATLVALAPPGGCWAAKALTGHHDRGRRDGALLYLPETTAIRTGWVAELLAALDGATPGELPPFVMRIGTGAGQGWAPDPGNGISFGQAICEAVTAAGDEAQDPARFARTARTSVDTLLASIAMSDIDETDDVGGRS